MGCCMGFEQPTPIQSEAIPFLLEGHHYWLAPVRENGRIFFAFT